MVFLVPGFNDKIELAMRGNWNNYNEINAIKVETENLLGGPRTRE